MEPPESTEYCKVIFTDGSKTGDKLGTGAAICGPRLDKTV
jgi:hypothetical protein